MHQILALLSARNKEYYRDKGSLAWSFIMPPLIIAVVALAFSRSDTALFTVGVLNDQPLPPTLQQDYIRAITFDDEQIAHLRVRHHQLDLLLDQNSANRVIFNPDRQQARVLIDLLRNSDTSLDLHPIEGQKVRYIDWVIPGILGMNLMFSGLYGVGYVIVRYRKNGVLKRLQAAPISPINFLAAQMLSRLMIMLAVSIIVYAVSDLFLGLLMLGSYLNLLLVAVLGNVCLLSLGLVIASRLANEELTNGLLNFLTFPMLLLSGVWFSLDGAPQWMIIAAQLLPLTHMIDAARSIMIEGAGLSEIAPQLLAMTAMTALFLGLAAILFKWKED